MKVNKWLVTAAAAVAVCLTLNTASAQDNGGNGGGHGGRGGRGGFGGGNFDPAQFQQRIMDMYKQRLEFTDDTEWKAVEPMVQKVSELQRESRFGGMRSMFGRRGGPGGDSANGDQNQSGRRSMFGQPNPEAEALQKAIDSKASKAEIKAALQKYQASRKAKQASLQEAQDNLRKVLTPRQEAIATLMGLL